jgi:hypothetical protein
METELGVKLGLEMAAKDKTEAQPYYETVHCWPSWVGEWTEGVGGFENLGHQVALFYYLMTIRILKDRPKGACLPPAKSAKGGVNLVKRGKCPHEPPFDWAVRAFQLMPLTSR